jgi:hypothetical protein
MKKIENREISFQVKINHDFISNLIILSKKETKTKQNKQIK